MTYTVENNQDTLIESVLPIMEQTFAKLNDFEPSEKNQIKSKSSPEIYFQIED